MRTIYLQRSLSINGRESLSGRVLADRLRRESDDFALGAVVLKEELFARAAPMVRSDAISEVQLLTFAPTVVVCEGGLFAGPGGTWKFAETLADDFVRGGGALVVADVELNTLRQQKREYQDVASFLGAQAAYRGSDPVAGYDERRHWGGAKQILCRTDEMIVSPWLRPVYDGVPEIVCGLPVRLATWGNILASGNRSSTWSDATDGIPGPDDLPWASVHRRGAGFVAFLAASVAGDGWLEGCRHNTTWLVNLCRFLSDAAGDERSRAQSLIRSEESLFLSHASVDKPTVAAVFRQLTGEHAVGSWIDEDEILIGDSLPDRIEAAIRRSTAFVLFWSGAAARSSWVRRELTAALQAPETTVLLVRLDGTEPPEQLKDVLWIEAAGLEPGDVAGRLAAAMTSRRTRDQITAARERGVVVQEAAAREKAAQQAPDHPEDASLTRGRTYLRQHPSRPIAVAGDLRPLELLGTIRSSYPVHILSFVDSGTLVSGSGRLDLEDLATARRSGLIEDAAEASCPTGMDGHFDDHRPSRRHLAFGYADVMVMNRSTGEAEAVVTAESSASVSSAAWSPGGDRIVVGSTNYLTIADDTGKVVMHRNMHAQDDDEPPQSVTWQPSCYPIYTNGRRVVVADADGRTIRRLGALPSPVAAVAVSPDSRYIAGSALGGEVVVWSEWGEQLLVVEGMASEARHPSRCLAFSADSRFLAQAAPVDGDGFLVVDLVTGRSVVMPSRGVHLLASHPSRADVLATAAGKVISLWRLGAAPGPRTWRTLG